MAAQAASPRVGRGKVRCAPHRPLAPGCTTGARAKSSQDDGSGIFSIAPMPFEYRADFRLPPGARITAVCGLVHCTCWAPRHFAPVCAQRRSLRARAQPLWPSANQAPSRLCGRVKRGEGSGTRWRTVVGEPRSLASRCTPVGSMLWCSQQRAAPWLRRTWTALGHPGRCSCCQWQSQSCSLS